MNMEYVVQNLFHFLSGIFFLPLLCLAAILGRIRRYRGRVPVLMCGINPIANNKYWSWVLSHIYESITFLHGYYLSFHQRDNLDIYPVDLFCRYNSLTGHSALEFS